MNSIFVVRLFDRRNNTKRQYGSTDGFVFFVQTIDLHNGRKDNVVLDLFSIPILQDASDTVINRGGYKNWSVRVVFFLPRRRQRHSTNNGRRLPSGSG